MYVYMYVENRKPQVSKRSSKAPTQAEGPWPWRDDWMTGWQGFWYTKPPYFMGKSMEINIENPVFGCSSKKTTDPRKIR